MELNVLYFPSAAKKEKPIPYLTSPPPPFLPPRNTLIMSVVLLMVQPSSLKLYTPTGINTVAQYGAIILQQSQGASQLVQSPYNKK